MVHVLADTGECGAGGARPAGRGLAPLLLGWRGGCSEIVPPAPGLGLAG